MELKPVRDYSQAQYPSFTEYFAKRRARSRASSLALAAALALLAAAFSGCNVPASG